MGRQGEPSWASCPRRCVRPVEATRHHVSRWRVELCCALHNFRVHLTPWQPMVQSGSTYVFSEPGIPRGRDKIERFFRTLNQRLFCGLLGYTPAGMLPAHAILGTALQPEVHLQPDAVLHA